MSKTPKGTRYFYLLTEYSYRGNVLAKVIRGCELGYYIEVPERKGKAEQIIVMYGGRILDEQPEWSDILGCDAIICVIDNGPWEAAGFAYDEKELDRFAEPDSNGPQRRRTWLLMDRLTASKLSGYRE